MKHLKLLTIIFIAIPTCTAMENTNKDNILTTLTTIKNPYYAQYLTDDRVIITGNEGYSIIDPMTNTETKKLSGKIVDSAHPYPGHLAVHPNKKKIALSHTYMKYNPDASSAIYSPIIYDYETAIYNTETGQLEWSKKQNSPTICKFNPFDEQTIFISYSYFPQQIVKYNYVEDKEEAIHNNYVAFSLHPTQLLICTVHNREQVSIHKTDPFMQLENAFKLPKNSVAISCEYSPDGSTIAIYQKNRKSKSRGIFIIKPALETNKYPFIQCVPEEKLRKFSVIKPKKIGFYSNKILAVLSASWYENHSFVYYWNIETQKLICTTQLDSPDSCNDFSFSPDGTKLLVTLYEDKCVIIPVPTAEILQNIINS